jgi:hypothetical protein
MFERLNPVSVGRRALRTLRGWERLLATAPTKLRPTLRQLQDGTIGVEFRIHDADGVVDRLVDGILAAASILASAELIGRRTGPRIPDASIPGAIALSVGVVTWRRLLANRVGHRSSFSRIRQLVIPPSQRGCGSPKLDALNRWTSDSPANRRRYGLDDGRPLERRDHDLSFLIHGDPNTQRPPLLPSDIHGSDQRPTAKATTHPGLHRKGPFFHGHNDTDTSTLTKRVCVTASNGTSVKTRRPCREEPSKINVPISASATAQPVITQSTLSSGETLN